MFNFKKNLENIEEMFTADIMTYVTGLNCRPHTVVLPVLLNYLS